jgi:uncharacterized membrane protein
MKLTTRQIAVAGVLSAITVSLGLMPVGGFIQIPGISVTTMHIPTILAGVFQGPVIGGIVGGIFGAFSFWRAFSSANPLDRLIFTNPLIAFLPRILIGIVSYYIFTLVRGKKGELVLSVGVAAVMGYTGYSVASQVGYAGRLFTAVVLAILGVVLVRLMSKRYGHGPAFAAVVGSLTNTVLVMALCVAFGYIPSTVAITVAITNGIPEATVAMILVSLIFRSTRSLIKPSKSI